MAVWALAAPDAVSAVRPEPSDRPLVGAIRWDAWYMPGSEPTAAVERSLSPAQYQSRLPFFARRDKASGTQVIQELREAGVSAVTCYKPEGDKIMRLNAQTGAMEGGFVHLPREAHWLADYLHELVTFTRGRYDAQVDSTAQALAWLKQSQSTTGIIEYYRMLCERNKHPVQKMVQLQAPAGVTHVYTMTGQQVAVRDGMVEVSEENRGPLMTAGFTLINEE